MRSFSLFLIAASFFNLSDAQSALQITQSIASKIGQANAYSNKNLFFSVMHPNLQVHICGRTLNYNQFYQYGKTNHPTRKAQVVSSVQTQDGILNGVIRVVNQFQSFEMNLDAVNTNSGYKVIRMVFPPVPDCQRAQRKSYFLPWAAIFTEVAFKLIDIAVDVVING
ncbi:unnamed protein product [Caenorhabditis angaria]|uniref:Uncharacterized protein n=1 Tax=Caenorhabditis angaria TaxID=860376 RepID=A0A9P1I4M4_9PELO|nr:unnamed protein product [Caenorhabditis angaria]